MAVTYPDCYTPFVEKEFDLNQPVSEELIRKLVQNANMLTKLSPIGHLKLMALNVAGVPTPDTLFFQRADGGSITEVTSPLVGTNTPDFTGKYVISASNTTSNSVVGNATQNLKHTHGPDPESDGTGTTGTSCVGSFLKDGSGGGNISFNCHDHTIPSDLDSDRPVTPIFYTLGLYMKIT